MKFLLFVLFLSAARGLLISSHWVVPKQSLSRVHVTHFVHAEPEIHFKSMHIRGILKEKRLFPDETILFQLQEKLRCQNVSISTDCEDLKTARRRVVSPRSVQMGIPEIVSIQALSDTSTVQKSELYVAFNISLQDFPAAVQHAIDMQSRRAVFSIDVSHLIQTKPTLTSSLLPQPSRPIMSSEVIAAVSTTSPTPSTTAISRVDNVSDEGGVDHMISRQCELMRRANIDYTVIKHGPMDLSLKTAGGGSVGEGRDSLLRCAPIRVVNSTASIPLPSFPWTKPHVKDLIKILVEVADIAKTFNMVYGVGAGNELDIEISSFMHAQGWSPRVQVGTLMGNVMENIQEKYLSALSSSM